MSEEKQEPPAAFTEWARLEIPLAVPASAWGFRPEQQPFWLRVQAALDAQAQP